MTIKSRVSIGGHRATDVSEAVKRKYQASSSLKKGSALDKLFSYVFHLILLACYFVYTIVRLVQYTNNKLRVRFLNLAYNPSKAPQLIREDVSKLGKIPKRLSVILTLKSEEEEGGGFYGLLNDAAEATTWTVAAGIPVLSIYEYDGVLKNSLEDLRISIFKKLSDYFGSSAVPTFSIRVPRTNKTYYGVNSDEDLEYKSGEIDIQLTLLSYDDGKPTIVELTKTMAELANKKEISPKDISIKLIDSELVQLIGYEPDLIVLFTPTLDLQGYPPWHIRLSEFYWEPDNEDVTYAIFLRALQKYSTCKINVGK
ncbi:hypothetical protein WICPIJ_003680 [Wickerhamomyces pijperi]|uniref:ditrans,polycis-polyprenyl diphosphate synthase [(2E,6E)-farnesyldiphosphate specific] n=1 Tax=Wickerhamomyces pijperi TaxID=599730 RepID=A0A9P8Q6Y5_WICPI|nr:hypothetical protein WICPIJ_003680 [Wickerhamomyces pijperi]